MVRSHGRETIANLQDYWEEIVVPDYNASKDDTGDLRLAFHCAISLFHMSDWVYVTHKATIDAKFEFRNRKTGVYQQVENETDFANAVSDISDDFELVRQVANTAKHLVRKSYSPLPTAPTHAANTAVKSTGFGVGAFSKGSWGGTPRIIIEPNIEFSEKASSVYEMWLKFRAKHGWN